MQSNKRIVVVGSINIDFVISAPRIPLVGETILGERSFIGLGGKGANQAVAISRLNMDVDMIGCMGDDELGRKMLSKLANENVGIEGITVLEGINTGQAFVIVNSEGDNAIVVSPGANAMLSPSLILEKEDLIKKADIMLVQLEIPIETVKEAINLAKKYNVKTILNPAPAIKLPNDIFDKIDILTPNETEGKLLINQKADSPIDSSQIIKELNDLGANQVILTQGKDGVSYNVGNDINKVPSNKVAVVDTTAAGDSFNAGLAVALAEGRSFSDAIHFAQNVASITITKQGAIPSLPYRNQID